MPEIKHNFLRGKMNKDHDERLVANGEYKDAMNIQKSTSEGSDIGTIQNILGNTEVGQLFSANILDANSKCIGSIADEKNNKIYYFVNNASDEIIQDPYLTNSTNWIATDSDGITEDYSGNGVLITTIPTNITQPNI